MPVTQTLLGSFHTGSLLLPAFLFLGWCALLAEVVVEKTRRVLKTMVTSPSLLTTHAPSGPTANVGFRASGALAFNLFEL